MANGDRRGVRRVQVNAIATLQALGDTAAADGKPVPVRVIDASANGMRLLSDVSMSAGQAVKLEVADALFLGEICYCASAPKGETHAFYLGLVSEECLTGLSTLQHLIQALQPESVPELEGRR